MILDELQRRLESMPPGGTLLFDEGTVYKSAFAGYHPFAIIPNRGGWTKWGKGSSDAALEIMDWTMKEEAVCQPK